MKVSKFDKIYSVKVKRVFNSLNSPNFSKSINHELDMIDPINENTGRRDGLLERFMNEKLTDAERNVIAQYLTKVGKSSVNRLSDDELCSLLPSRYNVSLADMTAVRDYLGSQITSYSDKSDNGSSDTSVTAENNSTQL